VLLTRVGRLFGRQFCITAFNIFKRH